MGPRKVLIAVCVMASLATPVHALVFSTAHPYDDLQHLERIGTHYAGYNYSSSAIVVCIPDYPYWEWPPAPESPRCIAGDEFLIRGVTIEADIFHHWTRVTGYCMTSGPWTSYPLPINATGLLESHEIKCQSPYYGRALFSIGCPTGCHVLRFGPGITTFDHLVFEGLLPP